MSATTNQELADRVEALVDARSVASVLAALSDVCGAKAEHILGNWQDKKLAREWAKVAKMVENLAYKVYL